MQEIDTQRFDRLTQFKANFDQIYTAPDPREYYRVLFGLDYVIPELAKPVFRALVEKRAELVPDRLKVLDLGCSYGINAALVRFPLDLPRLARRYVGAESFGLTPKELIDLDRSYFSSWPQITDARFIGQDTSKAAIDYATRVGLLSAGVTSNLEENEPSERERTLMSGVDLILSTGCVGYITSATFRQILDLQEGRMPWVANFVLRMYPFDTIARDLEDYGLVTEKVHGVTFVQRRFHSKDEFESTVDALRDQNIDPRGKEAEGLLDAELFISRPKEDVAEMPLEKLVSVTSGAGRAYGRRFRELDGDTAKLMH